ncbi:hypothetical protein P0D71_04870 [Paraburkholderia sp. RL17-383-BIF-A]|uniref:hypothetical protein n=1 Tax=Burkholderiaceae TaxID=119060 RepID=UPI0025705AC1|nr:hypothetical protein [Burkholderia sp. WP9]
MDTIGDQCLRVGEHADDDLQRHQYRIKRNTDKCTFARNAMFFGGLGSGGGRHLRSGLEEVQSLHSTRRIRRRVADAKKIPFKSAAYLNEKHSRSSFAKYMRQPQGILSRQ